MQPSDEIKSKLDIVEVLREYIQLKPAGVNFRALCPFHREKTPSFVVSPEKQIWHCFGCGKGGDLIAFVKEIEGFDFIEALRHLAPRAGVTLKREAGTQPSRRNRLLDLLDLSAKYYEKVLERSSVASAARQYLEKRGLKRATIENWRIGFSPDSWDDLLNLLKRKGYLEDEISAAGMLVRRENRTGSYNRFRGRIMFPISDIAGHVVGFSARVAPGREKEDKLGKYINSPQSAVYDKSKIIFGLDKARRAIKERDAAVVVEGQMDVITAHQAGFTNTVASSGTAFSAEQIALLKRYSDKVVFAFDADQAGVLALERGAREALRSELTVKVAVIPAGKDPDECIRQDPALWAKAVEDASPLVGHLIDLAWSAKGSGSAEGGRKAVAAVLPAVSLIANPVEREFWANRVAERAGVRPAIIFEELERTAKKSLPAPYRIDKKPAGFAAKDPVSRDELQSEILLSLVLKFPLAAQYALMHMPVDYIAGGHNKAIYRIFLIYYNNIANTTLATDNNDATTKDLYGDFLALFEEEYAEQAGDTGAEQIDKEKALAHLRKVVLLGEQDFYGLSSDNARSEVAAMAKSLKASYISSRLKEMEGIIAAAERGGGTGAERLVADDLIREFKLLLEEKRMLEEGG